MLIGMNNINQPIIMPTFIVYSNIYTQAYIPCEEWDTDMLCTMLMYIACLSPNLVFVHFMLLDSKFPNVFIYLY